MTVRRQCPASVTLQSQLRARRRLPAHFYVTASLSRPGADYRKSYPIGEFTTAPSRKAADYLSSTRVTATMAVPNLKFVGEKGRS